MQLSRNFYQTRFSADVLKEASTHLFEGMEAQPSGILSVHVDGGEWDHDSQEEFFSDYRRSKGDAYFRQELADRRISVQQIVGPTVVVKVSVQAPSRATILKVFDIFEKHLESSRIPRPPRPPVEPPVVFIGHGRSAEWRDLKDHLTDKHGIKVEAYEIGARAGHAIRDVLSDMLRNSSFAILVMTGEDADPEGGLRARQNVVHEAGLFQGHLGFNRAIVLLEENVEAFSNIQGLAQIRFTKGRILETYGEVLATIRRELYSD